MKKFLLWMLAFLMTIASAVYQRLTGPTHPFRGKAALGDSEIRFRLPRSAENVRDCEVGLKVADPEVSGTLSFKRFKTDDPWTQVGLERKDDLLTASLPKQPEAAKLAYKILLKRAGKEVSLSGEKPIIIRFKGRVPLWILLPHIIIMFLAMLFSTMAGIAALGRTINPRKLVLWTVVLLFIGGFILGPAVQKLSFGSFWTGIPFGWDLTDNKTLIAFAVWIAALVTGRRGKPSRGWVLAAAGVMLIVFLIPHSVLGSEFKH